MYSQHTPIHIRQAKKAPKHIHEQLRNRFLNIKHKTYTVAKPAPKYIHEELKKRFEIVSKNDKKYVVVKRAPKHIHNHLKKRLVQH
jgi:hypothetical protein